MFTLQSEWVVDGCCGSGSGLVAGVQLARNVVAVDVDRRCSQYVELRMASLSELLTEEQEIGEVGGYAGNKIFRKEPMVNVSKGSRGTLLTLRSNVAMASVVPGPPQFQPCAQHQQTLPEAFKRALSKLDGGAAVGIDESEAGDMDESQAGDMIDVEMVRDSVGQEDLDALVHPFGASFTPIQPRSMVSSLMLKALTLNFEQGAHRCVVGLVCFVNVFHRSCCGNQLEDTSPLEYALASSSRAGFFPQVILCTPA